MCCLNTRPLEILSIHLMQAFLAVLGHWSLLEEFDVHGLILGVIHYQLGSYCFLVYYYSSRSSDLKFSLARPEPLQGMEFPRVSLRGQRVL